MAAIREAHFVKFFISEKSSRSFEIPLVFNEYLPNPLPTNVEVLSYRGRSWTVRMKRRGEKVFLRNGWEDFVNENNLEDGKLMQFTYDCNRTFSVLIFGHDGCSELRDFPQDVIDVIDDYEFGEQKDEEEEEENNSN
ncbi:B3 domain-containing protein [Cardamine amara subsp. amara]|uniref:B3 domain-containing protein n=1 Tax=Cardamine amara subsp. amara TaxID=228776 RepID=A0ABD1BVV7_CARAN